MNIQYVMTATTAQLAVESLLREFQRRLEVAKAHAALKSGIKQRAIADSEVRTLASVIEFLGAITFEDEKSAWGYEADFEAALRKIAWTPLSVEAGAELDARMDSVIGYVRGVVVALARLSGTPDEALEELIRKSLAKEVAAE